jgi:hypothetical protein
LSIVLQEPSNPPWKPKEISMHHSIVSIQFILQAKFDAFQAFQPVLSPAGWKLESNFFVKNNFFKNKFLKINYFSMFDSVMKNQLKNIFQYLAISWKIIY